MQINNDDKKFSVGDYVIDNRTNMKNITFDDFFNRNKNIYKVIDVYSGTKQAVIKSQYKKNYVYYFKTLSKIEFSEEEISMLALKNLI